MVKNEVRAQSTFAGVKQEIKSVLRIAKNIQEIPGRETPELDLTIMAREYVCAKTKAESQLRDHEGVCVVSFLDLVQQAADEVGLTLMPALLSESQLLAEKMERVIAFEDLMIPYVEFNAENWDKDHMNVLLSEAEAMGFDEQTTREIAENVRDSVLKKLTGDLPNSKAAGTLPA